MPDRIEHANVASAAMHIMLTVAMHRLGLRTMEVTQAEYEEAIKGTKDLNIQFDGDVYRAVRL